MTRKVLNVEYFSQRDNEYAPFVSCYPTSMAMAVDYCLKESDLSKQSVGCPVDMQLEDYINQITMSYETKKWLIKNAGRLGAWIWKYKPRTIAYVEQYIFNKLMFSHGYRCQFTTEVTFAEYCNIIDSHRLPQILHGDFSKKTKVFGHIVCGIGYIESTRQVIVHDPYGNAETKYLDEDGNNMEYYFNDFFIKNKKTGTTWLTSILRR